MRVGRHHCTLKHWKVTIKLKDAVSFHTTSFYCTTCTSTALNTAPMYMQYPFVCVQDHLRRKTSAQLIWFINTPSPRQKLFATEMVMKCADHSLFSFTHLNVTIKACNFLKRKFCSTFRIEHLQVVCIEDK